VVDPSKLPAANGGAAGISPPPPGSGVSPDEYRKRKEDAAGNAGIAPGNPANAPALLLHFDDVDSSRDGLLSKGELEAFYATLHERIDALMGAAFGKADLNGDGKLDIGEVQALWPMLAALFIEMDANGDSYVTPDEFTCRWGP
jgi:Ca2+-binding EF-hand superfamily protein